MQRAFSKSSQPLIPPKHFISLHLLFSIHYWRLSVLKYIYLTWFVFQDTYLHQISIMKTLITYCNLRNQIIFLYNAPLMCQAVLAVCAKSPQGQLIGVGPPCGLQKTRRVFWHLVWTRKEYPIESAFGCYSKQRHVKMILTH